MSYGIFCITISVLPLCIQLSTPGCIFGYQVAGGLIIIALAIAFCTFLFMTLWLLPIKALYYVTTLHW